MKRDHLSLFVFIDAFGWEVFKRNDFFMEGERADARGLNTILGYSSACDPSIISGRLPGDHLLWSSFYYSPETSPFRRLTPLGLLPKSILNRGRVRSLLSRGVKRAYGFTGYFQLYNVPFPLLPLFDYAEKYSIWVPGGLPRGTSIFDDLAGAELPYAVFTGDGSDAERMQILEDCVAQGDTPWIYVAFGKLDALMHRVGNDHAEITDLVRWYDDSLRRVLNTARNHFEEVSWYVFSDHGMHNVHACHDLQREVEALGLDFGTDYVAFYDSTMLRLWFLKDAARAPLTDLLTEHPRGRIIPDDELRSMGTMFEDGMYGDLVFLIDSGVLIMPSFMGSKPIAGMHGYHPDDPDAIALLCASREIPTELVNIEQIYGTLRAEAGLPRRQMPPRGEAGDQ